MAKTIKFNTGRKYTADGQIIIATLHDDGVATFHDTSRMITGEFAYGTAYLDHFDSREFEREVMHRYDHYEAPQTSRSWNDGMAKGACNTHYGFVAHQLAQAHATTPRTLTPACLVFLQTGSGARITHGAVTLALVGNEYALTAPGAAPHRLAMTQTDATRLNAHWQAYCEAHAAPAPLMATPAQQPQAQAEPAAPAALVAPARLNGYGVNKSQVHKNCVTVAVYRPDEPELPFVVATWWPELGNSWSWGHYVSRADMLATFRDVAARNANR